jgi:hypothetical protein
MEDDGDGRQELFTSSDTATRTGEGYLTAQALSDSSHHDNFLIPILIQLKISYSHPRPLPSRRRRRGRIYHEPMRDVVFVHELQSLESEIEER